MSSRDLITVLMPTYNAARWVDRAIQSVLSQTYSNFELLILDDGSTDQTREILSQYPDPRIRVLSRENRGLGATLNEGVQLSNGKYIARMDADDECDPERLIQQHQFLEQHRSCGLVHSRVDFIDTNNDVVSRNIGIRADSIGTKWQLIWKNAVYHPTVMMCSDVLDKHGLNYDAKLRSSEDFDLWNRLAHVTDIEILPKSLLRYRLHDDSFTRTNQKDFHFDCFVKVLATNFARYQVNLDRKQMEELAVLSEHTKVDPRHYRYNALEQTLTGLYSETNASFCRLHGLNGGELDLIQSEQILTWSRYMLNTSRLRAGELLFRSLGKSAGVIMKKLFWFVFAALFIPRRLQPAG